MATRDPATGRHRHPTHETGITSLEMVGLALVSALVIGAISAAVHTSGLAQQIGCAVSQITGQAVVCAAAPGGDAGSDAGSDETRRDAERDTRDNRRDDARGNRSGGGGGAGEQPTTPGGTAPTNGLGAGVPGSTPPTMPSPPAWTAPDEGAGAHASEDPDMAGRATVLAAETAANAMAGKWPDASRNLLHFLGNTGETLDQDVDSMLASSQNFSSAVDLQRNRVIASAVEQAQAAGATGPTTFPVNTPWLGVYLDDDHSNWYYALNGIAYNQTGYVTVTPPASPGGQWSYTWSTTVHIRDQYNWDGSKQTQIGPFTVTDEQLADLHRKGLAREYTAVGTSSTRTSSGNVP